MFERSELAISEEPCPTMRELSTRTWYEKFHYQDRRIGRRIPSQTHSPPTTPSAALPHLPLARGSPCTLAVPA
jgi:hypothetical protein